MVEGIAVAPGKRAAVDNVLQVDTKYGHSELTDPGLDQRLETTTAAEPIDLETELRGIFECA